MLIIIGILNEKTNELTIYTILYRCITSPSDFAPAASKEFLDIQATIECGFTLKRVRDMIKHTIITLIIESLVTKNRYNTK